MPSDSQNECKLSTVEDPEFANFIKNNPRGITLIPHEYGESKDKVIYADAGDFAKWLRINASQIQVNIPQSNQLALHSCDIWLSLVYLAHDVALPIYLNCVSSFIYNKMRGSLKGEKARVRFSVVYEEAANGITKRFDFDGDSETLQKVIHKFDVNSFLNG